MNDRFWGKKVVSGVLVAGSIILTPAPRNSSVQAKPTNPLEIEIDSTDPVIPLGYQRRKLSTFEINRIQREMARLDRDAGDKLRQGDGNKAFTLWYRQLKLARVLGEEREIIALGKVGKIAWSANRAQDVRNIANRLLAIESTMELQSPPLRQLQQLATAYQQVRYLERAIAIYQKISQSDQLRQNLAARVNNQQILGELYLAQFNYPAAAAIYEELLALAQDESPSSSTTHSLLITLAEIYDRTGQTTQAISTKKNLVRSYTTTNQTEKLAQLELAIAENYQTLSQTPKAISAYEQAFTLALAEQQLAIASDVLSKLAQLYQREGENQQAISTYRRLLQVQSQSYNYYGLINTHDTLGNIYLQLDRTQQARK
ncbi:MAG: tetratricopeptide repeat protein, partial [Cyanobacteria bacterium J06623_7]